MRRMMRRRNVRDHHGHRWRKNDHRLKCLVCHLVGEFSNRVAMLLPSISGTSTRDIWFFCQRRILKRSASWVGLAVHCADACTERSKTDCLLRKTLQRNMCM
ncbi:unnamed protein product [Cladocopium goreaui]|uniref:Uncharacterized protein n=1 Tax=Cladocopium goreaui TaxID=2562237 RepID=A0A9P1G431_9DINO|nr:unnamed protein product [Cladocopium goreaui]